MANGVAQTVPNYLVRSIISLICCWPLGIPALIFAAQVNGKLASGDMAGALESSAKAKKFSTWAFIGGAIAYTIVILINVIAISLPFIFGNS